MAKPLILSLDGQEFAVQLAKVDRDKLYGSVEVEAFDEHGHEAYLRVLAADGKTIIDKGGTALGMIDEQGEWADRKNLVPVNEDGEQMETVESSFGKTNTLKPATMEEYLSQIVKSVYVLEAEETSDADFLKSNIAATDSIYKFDFSYRGGLEYDSAFLIGNGKDAFMILGSQAKLQFVKLNQATVLDSIEEQEISAEEIEFDLL